MQNTPLEQDAELRLKKLLWASRRGMLELDVIITPYIEVNFSKMSLADYQLMERFLEEADPDLYAWLMGFEVTVEPYQKLVATIQTFIEQQVAK